MQRTADWEIRGKNAVKTVLNILCRPGRTVPFRMKMASRRTCSRTIVYGRGGKIKNLKKNLRNKELPRSRACESVTRKNGPLRTPFSSALAYHPHQSQSFLRHTCANSTGCAYRPCAVIPTDKRTHATNEYRHRPCKHSA